MGRESQGELEEGRRFELLRTCALAVFKTAAIDHSAIPPRSGFYFEARLPGSTHAKTRRIASRRCHCPQQTARVYHTRQGHKRRVDEATTRHFNWPCDVLAISMVIDRESAFLAGSPCGSAEIGYACMKRLAFARQRGTAVRESSSPSYSTLSQPLNRATCSSKRH